MNILPFLVQLGLRPRVHLLPDRPLLPLTTTVQAWKVSPGQVEARGCYIECEMPDLTGITGRVVGPGYLPMTGGTIHYSTKDSIPTVHTMEVV